MMLKITLRRSFIGRPGYQRQVAKGLGLRKIDSSVIKEDNPVVRGMLKKIDHLVEVEESK